MNDTLPPPQLIEKPKQLQILIADLQSQPRLAIDTESNSLYAYPEQVCLIQISTPDADYLLDPLKLPGMKSLAEVMANTKVEKVFHAADYDFMCLKRDFDFQIRNLFDTRVALRTLGRKQTGLGDVLWQEFGVKINKRWQRANWGQRPLPEKLLNYARLDTHYLLELRARLEKELHKEGRWEEALEICFWKTQIEHEDHSFDPAGFWRLPHAHNLSPAKAAVLREVYLYREKQARLLNRPPFKVMGNKTLVAIAREQPTSMQGLEGIHGMTSSQIRRYGQDLLEAIRLGQKSRAPSRPKRKPLPDAVIQRYKRLRQWRKRTAASHHVESDLILPRDFLWDIARQAPRDRETLQEIMKPLEWRFQTYWEEILKIIRVG